MLRAPYLAIPTDPVTDGRRSRVTGPEGLNYTSVAAIIGKYIAVITLFSVGRLQESVSAGRSAERGLEGVTSSSWLNETGGGASVQVLLVAVITGLSSYIDRSISAVETGFTWETGNASAV